MILGLIPSEQAGLLLVRFMRRMAEAGDDNLQDWLAGDWPALFANKPATVLPALRELCADRTLDWYIRTNAVDPIVAAAERRGPEALDEALAWVARIDLAKEQAGFGMHFSSEDVTQAYAAGPSFRVPRRNRAAAGKARARRSPKDDGEALRAPGEPEERLGLS